MPRAALSRHLRRSKCCLGQSNGGFLIANTVENIDIDFLCGNRGAEPIVNVSDNYTDKIQWVKETIEGFIDLLFREYESCTLTEEFISYATFEGLEFDEMGYWVDKDDDDYFIY